MENQTTESLPVSEEFSALAERFASRNDPIVKSFGAILNFSVASVAALDYYIDEMWGIDGDGRDNSSYQLSQGKFAVALDFGAYLGEVIRRHVGGTWEADPSNRKNPYTVKLVFPDGGFIAPVLCLFNRFKNGSGDSIMNVLEATFQDQAPEKLKESAPSFYVQADAFLKSSLPKQLADELSRGFRAAAQGLEASGRTPSALKVEVTGDTKTVSPQKEKPAEAPLFELEPSVQAPVERGPSVIENKVVVAETRPASALARENLKKASLQAGIAKSQAKLNHQQQKKRARANKWHGMLTLLGVISLLALTAGYWVIGGALFIFTAFLWQVSR